MISLRRIAYSLAVRDGWEPLVRSTRMLENLAYRSARKYVGGMNLEDTRERIRDLVSQGFLISLDFFGEGLDEPSEVDEVLATYRRASVTTAEFGGKVDLEVVPSHVGIDHSVDFFVENTATIGSLLVGGSRLQVSGEESHRTERIIAASIELRKLGIPVVTTVQANLLRSRTDVERLVEADVGIRLVKGAYLEPATTAHAWGEPTDRAFVRLAHQVRSHGVDDIALATHDPVLHEALLPVFGAATVEMLLGVRHPDAVHLVEQGTPVRLYVPFGDDWFRYWVRRLVESL